MKLFGKKLTPNPQVIFGAIDTTYEPNQEWWQFAYEGIEHFSHGPVLRLFDISALELMRTDVSTLMPEMKQRLEIGWKEWGEVKLDDGENYIVDVTNFQEKQEYRICWSGGASWGDMGIEFTVRDHKIVDEDWGD